MAVHEPHARVVGLEADDQVPVHGQHGHVPARRVLRAEGVVACVEGGAALGQDDEVVPVQVDRVCGGDGAAVRGVDEGKEAFDDEVDPVGVGAVDGDGSVGGGEGGGAVGRAAEDGGRVGEARHGPVDVEGAVGELPVEDVLPVAREVVVRDVEGVAGGEGRDFGRVAGDDGHEGHKGRVGAAVGAWVEFEKGRVGGGGCVVADDAGVGAVLLGGQGAVAHVDPEIGVSGGVGVGIHDDFVSLSYSGIFSCYYCV